VRTPVRTRYPKYERTFRHSPLRRRRWLPRPSAGAHDTPYAWWRLERRPVLLSEADDGW